MKKITGLLLVLAVFALMSFSLNISRLLDQDKWLAPATAKELTNPFTGDESISKGKEIYQTRCAVCHGEAGAGDGPAGKALTPAAADHASATIQSQTDGELFWKISEGRGAMVGWKLIITEEDRWALVNYIRTLAE